MTTNLSTTINPQAGNELLNPDGTERLGWQPVLSALDALSADQIAVRQKKIAKLLRSNGIAYGEIRGSTPGQRPWQLDLIPQIVEAADWQRLTDGLVQRARMKQALFADLYGRQNVVRDGIIPAALVYAHDGYLRSAQELPGSDNLPLFSTEVARSPSGEWYVLRDNCQSPNGIGYALENRLVLSNVLPELYRESRVSRVVNYFRTLQGMLSASVDRDERCVMLSYGSAHPHYFEHAYLAKYLGYTLVEINDLTVRGQRVWLRTVSGLQRVNVIFRFVDDQDSDPLAFHNGARVGVPGLLQAARAGSVRIINPIGIGILDNPGFDAYLQALCKYYLNEPLQLLSVPTYWLGDKEQLAHVQSRFDELLFRDINAPGPSLSPGALSDTARQSLLNSILLEPESFIAQERIDRSLTPCLIGKQRTSRQVTLRTYLVSENTSYRAMAGALCLLDDGATLDSAESNTTQGSKDVWVLSTKAVIPDTLLPARNDLLDYAVLEGELPSRVAENLFWVGRNAERAENIIRVLRITCQELQNQELIDTSEQRPTIPLALLKAVTVVSSTEPGFVGTGAHQRLRKPNHELLSLMYDADRIGSLAQTLQQLQRSANAARDRISLDVLRILNKIDDQQRQLQRMAKRSAEHSEALYFAPVIERLSDLLASLAALTGLTHENITHGDGWRFMMLGRRLDRARQGAAVLGTVLIQDRDDSLALENLLRIFDSVMTYRSRYRSHVNNRLVMQLLLMDESNPRSIAFQMQQIDEHIRKLPGMRRADNRDPLFKLATAGLSRIRLADPTALLKPGHAQRQTLKTFLSILNQVLLDIGTTLSAAYFTHTELPHNIETARVDTEHRMDQD